MYRLARALLSLAILTSTLSIAALPRGPAQAAQATQLGAGEINTAGVARDKLSTALRTALDIAGPADRLRVIVRLKSVALPLTTNERKREATASVVTHLQADALTQQRAALDFLAQPAVAAQSGEVRSLWVINALALTAATPAVISALAARDDVEVVVEDRWRQWITPPNRAGTFKISSPPTFTQDGLTGVYSVPPASGDTTWGIKRIRADQVWRGLGITGSGVVVANMDTGVDWNHPSLYANYRGRGNGPAADHAHNWLDTTNEGSLYPTDGTGHGTHTMGTLAGANGIGVAPGAKWMAVKALNSDGFGYDTWIHEAFQFILAPGGRPDLAPDVLNNSWGSDDGFDTSFRDDVRAVQRAGIFTVFSNGNAGPLIATVGSPASFPESIGVGATTSDDGLAFFSSLGPSPFGQITKPDLSAPGVGVISAFPGAAYAALNGTSMASPHVAGTAALLLSARPALTPIDVLSILTQTATPLSSTLPNNFTGWGRVDAYAAVLQIIDTGVIDGYVRDGATPVPNAEVIASNSSGLVSRALTDGNGYYAMQPAPGVYSVAVTAFGYTSAAVPPRIVVVNSNTRVDLGISALPSGILRGTVRDAASGAFVTATVRALNTPRSVLSNLTCVPCRYSLDLPAGDYIIEARATGYAVQTQTASVANGGLATLDFSLNATQRIAFVDTGAWYHRSAAQYYRDAFESLRLAVDEYSVKDALSGGPPITTLLSYDAVVWSAPLDAPTFVRSSIAISEYLATGRSLILTGQNIAYHDGGGSGFDPYLGARVNARYLANDSDTRMVFGQEGGPLEGITLTLTGGDSANNQNAPDMIAPANDDLGDTIASYRVVSDTQTGAVTLTGVCSRNRAALYGFGIESINGVQQRADVISRTLAALAAPRPLLGLEVLPRNILATDAAIGRAGSKLTHAIRVRNTGAGGITQTFSLALGASAWPTQLSSRSVTLAPCASALITATVNIPATAQRGEHDRVDLTVQAVNAPSLNQLLPLRTKTPESILLVDDDRWFEKEAAFQDALVASGQTADRWNTGNMAGTPVSPALAFLSQYPIVIWFNAYDWYDPITPEEEQVLAQYLAGGGRVFMTSQAALAYTGRSTLMRQYFGVDGIDFTDVTSSVIGMNDTVLGDAIPGGSMLPFPYTWNLSSAVLPTRQAEVLLRGESLQPFALIRDGSVWRTAFMPLAFETLPEQSRTQLMKQLTGWLSPAGASKLRASTDTPAAGERITLNLTARMDGIALPEGETLTIEWFAPTGLSLQTPPLSETVPVSGGVVIEREGFLRVDDQVAPGTILPVTVRLRLNKSGFVVERQQRMRIGAPKVRVTQQHTPGQPRWGERITMTVQIAETGGRATSGWVISNVVPSGVTLDVESVSVTGADWQTHGNVLTLSSETGAAQISATFAMTLPLFSGNSPSAYQMAVLVNDGSGEIQPFQRWVTPFTSNIILTMVSRPSN